MTLRHLFLKSALAAALVLPALADISIDDLAGGDDYALGFDVSYYGLNPADYPNYIPVPVGQSRSLLSLAPGALGGLRLTTFTKLQGSPASPMMDHSYDMATYSSAFNNRSVWSLSYGSEADLNFNCTACGADRLRVDAWGQLDTNANGSGVDGTPLTVTVMSGGITRSVAIEMHCNPAYLSSGGTVDDMSFEFLFSQFPGIDFSSLDRISFSFTQDAENQAVDYGVAGFSFNCRADYEVGASEIPMAFQLEPNVPNPFNPATTIAFHLDETAPARLAVHDLAGRQLAVLVDGMLERGEHRYTFLAGGLPSGVYFYTLESGGRSQTQKMLLVK